MAGRSDAATDRVSLASAPAVTALTVMAWAKVVNSASPLFHEIVRLHNSSGANTSWIIGFKGANGRTPSVYSASNTTGIAGAEVTLGTWVFVCATLSGTAAQLLTGTTPGSLTKVTGTVGATAPDGLTLFSRSASDGSEWLDGSLAYVRVYTAVLSDAEITTESQSTTPVRASGLWADWPFAAAALTDASGAGRNLTAGTTALASDTDPPLSTVITGNGAAVAQTAQAAGTGTVTVTGSGVAVAAPAAAAGVGAVRVSGAGTATAAGSAAAGSGSALVSAAGAAVAGPAVAVGAGSVVVSGAGAAVVPLAVAGGDGATLISGAGSAIAPAAVAAGTGGLTEPVTGSGTALAPVALASGFGAVVITGHGAAVAPAAVARGAEQGVAVADEPRLTIRPNLAVLTLGANSATLTIDQGGT